MMGTPAVLVEALDEIARLLLIGCADIAVTVIFCDVNVGNCSC